MDLFAKKLSDNAKIPVKATEGAAGYDLYSSEIRIIPPHRHTVIPTDIALQIPKGCYGKIEPRSGLALKYMIDVLAGVCDADYRGPIDVLLINHSDREFLVEKHMRVAQLIIIPYAATFISEVKELDPTLRGTGGFGSTGTK
jgi:dUTP pyrophosphatase